MVTKSLRAAGAAALSGLTAAFFAAVLAVAAAPFAAHISPLASLQAQAPSTQAFAFSDWSGQVKGDVLDTAIIKLRPHEYNLTANIHNDGVAKGDVIYLYNLGTTSKWQLDHVDGTDYYFISAFQDFSGRRTPRSDLFDVDGQSKKSGAIVHSWSGAGSKDYSRQWRFERQSNGTYLIINRNSGLYLSLEGTPSNTEGHKFAQNSTPMYWDMEIVGVDNYGADGTAFDYSVVNQYSSFPGANWMKDLSDSAKLTELSIPGTHDSGTCHTYGDIEPQTSFTACQQYYIREQLAAGARFFDIRMGIDGVSELDPYINHGGTVCETENGLTLQLSQVISYFRRFLDANPSEFVIMLASHSGGDTKNQANSLHKYIEQYPDLFYIQADNTIPTVGELRGKIYLMHRLNLEGTGYGETDLGVNLSSWGSYDYATSDHNPVQISSPNFGKVFVQDRYDTNAEGKFPYIVATMDAADAGSRDALYINYTSCTKNNPFTAARNVNNRLYYEAPLYNHFLGHIGILVMDFMDAHNAYCVYRRNPGVHETFTAFYHAPLTGSNHTGTWIQNNKWWYAHTDGTYTTNGWELINNKWYAFDGEGWMRTGWHKDKGKWYYLDATNGDMATGWTLVKGTWYYLDPETGAMVTGWLLDHGTWYYLDPTSGALQSGWLKDSGTWYCLNPFHDGSYGAMFTGWTSFGDGMNYYLDPTSGAMAVGWFKADDGKHSEDQWYYAGKDGDIYSGWLLYKDSWYYLNKHYGAPERTMVTGWKLIDGTWYYFNPESGVMAADTWIDDYYVNASGAWEPDKKPETTPKEEIEIAPLPPVTNPDEDAVTEEPDETDEPIKTDETEDPAVGTSATNETASESAHEIEAPEAESVLV